MHNMLRRALAACLAATAASAHASWYEASSRHFVIYADGNPKQLQDFATKLERFDQAVRGVMHYDDPPVGDGNRLTVFVLPTVKAVRDMAGGKDGSLLGFYQPRAEGCLAFVPKSTGIVSEEIDTNTVFFHEYTHHLQFENLTSPIPEWLVEGFATFMQTAQFKKDGGIMLGSPPLERAWGLLGNTSIPLNSLLDGGYRNLDETHRDLFYGEGWLLTHYLYMSTKRPGQLGRYLALLNSGTPRLDAAQQAFGDLAQLEHELDGYKYQHRLFAITIGAARTQPGPIDVVPLSQGGADVILLRADLKLHGGDRAVAQRLLGQIRALEAAHPGDELVETTLAEAALDAGDTETADAAAGRALKANPRNVEAMIYNGRVVEARARSKIGEDRRSMFQEARSSFTAANRIDTEDPEPLYDFYQSYLLEGVRPTDNAIAALHYASVLVPQDMGLRMNSAIAYLNGGNGKEARSTLAVVAYSPHGAEVSEVARRMIGDIDRGDLKAALFELRRARGQTASAH